MQMGISQVSVLLYNFHLKYVAFFVGIQAFEAAMIFWLYFLFSAFLSLQWFLFYVFIELETIMKITKIYDAAVFSIFLLKKIL